MVLTSIFNRVEAQITASKPFALYRYPADNDVHAVFQNDDNTYTVKDYDEQGFIFAPFSGYNEALTLPFKFSERIRVAYDGSTNISNSQIKPSFSLDEKERHIQLVEKAVNTINTTSLEKVVISRIHKASTEKTAIEIFQDLLDNYSNAFVYLWFHPKTGLWLGATPETLISIQGQDYKTMSLAGTKENLGENSLAWTNKEREEQAIVTRAITANLEDESTSIETLETHTENTGNILHLKTIIKGRLKYNFKLKNILQRLHPTPAVCGMPTLLAQDFIASNEHYDRQYYTGFLGVISKTSPRRINVENLAYRRSKIEANLFVNLRCLSLQNNFAKLYVGGGITKDSIPNDEFEETLNKAKTMLKVL